MTLREYTDLLVKCEGKKYCVVFLDGGDTECYGPYSLSGAVHKLFDLVESYGEELPSLDDMEFPFLHQFPNKDQILIRELQ